MNNQKAETSMSVLQFCLVVKVTNLVGTITKVY